MKKICSILSTLLLTALLLMALCIAGPMALGYKELTVLSGSMEPNIPVGSVVCVDTRVAAAELAEGEVVTYKLENGTFVTHRVVSNDVENRQLITRGDANDNDDAPVSYGRYYGRVKLHIPYLGYITTGVRTPRGILAVTAVVVVIILLNSVPALLTKTEEAGEKSENK